MSFLVLLHFVFRRLVVVVVRSRTAEVDAYLTDRLGAEAVKSVIPQMMDSDYALLRELLDSNSCKGESSLLFRGTTTFGDNITSQPEKANVGAQHHGRNCSRSGASCVMEPGAAVQEASDLQRVLQTLAVELLQASQHQSKVVAEVELAESTQSRQLLEWTREVALQQRFDSIAQEKQERATSILQQISERNLRFHREALERLRARAAGFETLSDLARQRKEALEEVCSKRLERGGVWI